MDEILRNLSAGARVLDLGCRDGSFPHTKGQFMGRFAIDRHRGGINVGFADAHTAKVPVKKLWTLNWHRDFEPNYNVKLP